MSEASSLPNILVTGANGFVGKALVTELAMRDLPVFALVRQASGSLPEKVKKREISDLTEVIDWLPIVQDIETVVHVAARAHIMNDASPDPLIEFRKVNTAVTLNLAKQAADAGVKRFIFVSSIKVNGELTRKNTPFKPNDYFLPSDPYGLSKYEAEQGLLEMSKKTEMEVVIIRPPLVYGPGVKANFASMMRWVKKGVPLPFGAVNNQRSFVALDNLVSFITCCIDHPKAANEVFLISDGEDVSTTQLLQKVGRAYGSKAKLLAFPVSLMEAAAKLVGKESMASRLFASLQVDNSKAERLLGWKPVITMDEQLKKIVGAKIHEKSV